MYLKLIINICLLFSLSACAGTRPRSICTTCDEVQAIEQKQALGKNTANSKEIIIDLDINDSSQKEIVEHSSLPNKKLPKNHYYINSDQMIKVKVSEKGYSRFFLDGEKVVDVFFYPQQNLKIKIHDEGFLIVVPLFNEETADNENNSSEEKTYLTIVGDHGTTQDLVLDFTREEPAPVKLIKPIPEIKSEKNYE